MRSVGAETGQAEEIVSAGDRAGRPGTRLRTRSLLAVDHAAARRGARAARRPATQGHRCDRNPSDASHGLELRRARRMRVRMPPPRGDGASSGMRMRGAVRSPPLWQCGEARDSRATAPQSAPAVSRHDRFAFLVDVLVRFIRRRLIRQLVPSRRATGIGCSSVLSRSMGGSAASAHTAPSPRQSRRFEALEPGVSSDDQNSGDRRSAALP